MAEPNTRLSGVKQELSAFKSEFSSSFDNLDFAISMLEWMKLKKTKISVTEEVNKNIMSIKNTIIDALK